MRNCLPGPKDMLRTCIFLIFFLVFKKKLRWNISQYHYGENGFIYFKDWNGKNKLCAPKHLQTKKFMTAFSKEYMQNITKLTVIYLPHITDPKCLIASRYICQKLKQEDMHWSDFFSLSTRPFKVISMDLFLNYLSQMALVTS